MVVLFFVLKCEFVLENFVFVCFVFHCAMFSGVFVCVLSALCVCVFMCLGVVVVVDCVMWSGMLFALFCVCVCCLFALFAGVIRMWYIVRCCMVL